MIVGEVKFIDFDRHIIRYVALSDATILKRNFRVKVGRRVVSWSGLVRKVGLPLAKFFLNYALVSKKDVIRFPMFDKCSDVVFYLKK